MATVGIWKIEKRLDRVINYTTNIEKTINSEYGKESYASLHNVVEYVNSDYKTEKQAFVSGINCVPEIALEEMVITKQAFNKTDGILGFHAFQSFKEGEVTPELAHEVGVKLAEEMWGDRFEVIVSTHTNTNHIHNHFVINSVSFKDGKKYYDNRTNYAKFRSLSNEICEEYGLSWLKEKACRNSKINYGNYYKGFTEKSNYHTIAKEDIDRAIAQAYSFSDFEDLVKVMGYEIIYRYNKISVRKPPYKQNIRIERSFGDEYSIDNIKIRIAEEQAPREPFPEAYRNDKTYNYFRNYKSHKKGSIYKLYLHYCYLLKVFPKQYPRKVLPASIRADVKIMDDISKETILLSGNKIETYEQFLLFKNSIIKDLDVLMDQRSKLWYKHKKNNLPSEKQIIRNEIDNLSSEIKKLQSEVRLCEHIEKRIPKIEVNINEFNDKENERKESELNALK